MSSEKPKRDRNAPVWVKILVGLHVLAITTWSLPKASPAVANGTAAPYGTEWLLYINDFYLRPTLIQHYLFTTGLWQSWSMFAPNPADTDIWGDAEIEYLDGTIARYQYPRMKLLPLTQKYPMERYRKFFENAHQNRASFLWPAFAQRVAEICYLEPENPPVRVKLFKHMRPTPPIMSFSEYLEQARTPEGSWLPPNPPLPESYNEVLLFEYQVDQTRLETIGARR
jgi:hypothetical protein